MSDKLVFVDSDIELTSEALANLVKDIHTSREAIIMAKVVHPPDSQLTVGTELFDVPSYFRDLQHERTPRRLRFEQFISCSFGITRDTFEAIGGFEESFVHYGYEDVEFAFRAETIGVDIVLSPYARVFHHKRLMPRDILQRSMALGRSAVHLVHLHPTIEDILPLGVREIRSLIIAFDRNFDPSDLLNRAVGVETRLRYLNRAARGCEARSLIVDCKRLYQEISQYGYCAGAIAELRSSRGWHVR